MVLQGAVQVLVTAPAEGLSCLVRQFFVQAAEKALIVDAHSLQEDHLELLAVSAELGCKSVALRLKFFL